MTGAELREMMATMLPDSVLGDVAEATGFHQRDRKRDAIKFLRTMLIAAASPSGGRQADIMRHYFETGAPRVVRGSFYDRGDCVDDMHVALYVVRGTRGHRVGVVVGRLETPAPSARRAGTLPDLVTTELETVQDDPRVPAVQRTHTRTYRFSGGVYRETRHTQSDSVCHHCARVWCDAAPAQ